MVLQISEKHFRSLCSTFISEIERQEHDDNWYNEIQSLFTEILEAIELESKEAAFWKKKVNMIGQDPQQTKKAVEFIKSFFSSIVN